MGITAGGGGEVESFCCLLLNCGAGEDSSFFFLEKTLESPLDSKEIKPANPKGNQLRIFIGRTDGEAEAPILWSPGAKN